MSMLTIRVDDDLKGQLQEIAKLKNLSLSGLVLSAVNELIENEFDLQLIQEIEKHRKSNEPTYDINLLYEEFGLKNE